MDQNNLLSCYYSWKSYHIISYIYTAETQKNKQNPQHTHIVKHYNLHCLLNCPYLYQHFPKLISCPQMSAIPLSLTVHVYISAYYKQHTIHKVCSGFNNVYRKILVYSIFGFLNLNLGRGLGFGTATIRHCIFLRYSHKVERCSGQSSHFAEVSVMTTRVGAWCV